MRRAGCLLALSLCCAGGGAAQQETAPAPPSAPVPIFGTTVVIPSGLQGLIYHIHRYSKKLPDFARMKPVGTIYTASLNIPVRDFKEGFPGITKRFEWFAIDYTGRFWISRPGSYRFRLTSDDGSKLYIDNNLAVDNDGQHPPETKEAAVDLAGGIHNIRVSYFQGPRFQVALVLEIAGPGEPLRVFSTDEFKPPPNPQTWKFPAPASVPLEQAPPERVPPGQAVPESAPPR